jgi:hypothetical protein
MPVLRLALPLLLALPGIYACVHLFPYQYIYYNSLARGVGGAYQKFELDYWALSYSESMQYINQNASDGTVVLVEGSRAVARRYAKPGLTIVNLNKKNILSNESPFYILSSTRGDLDLLTCQKSDVVYMAARDGGILSYVQKVNTGRDCR